ncbi:hypothetical protein GCM10010915_05000 [Microbacterium faecale]|uniref:Uncharacterized protein n=1 Tax=Microbacterium faecale TaxID=1804630 RepID=A0A916Y2G7_9MICO|nr:hypothetical protein GCM10010915_05000 [Microbacterium faecale]
MSATSETIAETTFVALAMNAHSRMVSKDASYIVNWTTDMLVLIATATIAMTSAVIASPDRPDPRGVGLAYP